MYVSQKHIIHIGIYRFDLLILLCVLDFPVFS